MASPMPHSVLTSQCRAACLSTSHMNTSDSSQKRPKRGRATQFNADSPPPEQVSCDNGHYARPGRGSAMAPQQPLSA